VFTQELLDFHKIEFERLQVDVISSLLASLSGTEIRRPIVWDSWLARLSSWAAPSPETSQRDEILDLRVEQTKCLKIDKTMSRTNSAHSAYKFECSVCGLIDARARSSINDAFEEGYCAILALVRQQVGSTLMPKRLRAYVCFALILSFRGWLFRLFWYRCCS
jgi:hypothetical protein